ncbi:SAVED domain-containing protein [Hoeflea poritis]|uniref:SAVED domain-containing protein n=1 Tax=Hoeflea poritis TaxID=2993659 RepID=A0ABT4VV68_9HYPH|nr:SAVED domain-containing protein [Hoeflea poritis]MDA4848600.1 SAVED domain-containing protein [Hoeflea poritis]
MRKIFILIFHFAARAIDYYFRLKNTPRYLANIGLILIGSSSITFGAVAAFQFGNVPITASFTFGDAPSAQLVLGFCVLVIGILFEIASHLRDIQRENRRRIAVIELRGLRGVSGAPLAEAIPKSIRGTKDPLLISLKPKDDGQIEPIAAIKEISTVVSTLQQREQGQNRADIVRVFGGLAPVPFLFLTGVMLDNEQGLEAILDWDRDLLKWRELDGVDDLYRFVPSNVQELPDKTDEVILAVSASFKVDIEGALQAAGDLPLVELDLENRSTTSHWSESKQIALAASLRNTVQILKDKGVKKIHLFLAAPASLSFRFGTQFDKRLSPPTIIYQYEPDHKPPFPWGISLPVAGKEEASIEILS